VNNQELERIVISCKNEVQLNLVYEDLKNLGINNFYVSYLDDLFDFKVVKFPSFTFVCINKSDFKKNIIKVLNSQTNNSNNYLPNNYISHSIYIYL
jgi:hypothetical protein